MSLSLRLVLAFAGVFVAGFTVLGFAAVRITGDSVERGLEGRIDSTVKVISDRSSFFIVEAPLREREYRQLADLMGFEILVLGVGDGSVAGSSLSEEVAAELLSRLPAGERFGLSHGGIAYRGARAQVAGRTVVLLSPAAPIEQAKSEARRPILVVFWVGLLVSIAAGAVLASTVTRPLRKLAESASDVREGATDLDAPRGGGREVTRLARAIREMLARLAEYRAELVTKEKMATLGQFSAAVAHELRNPLSSMRMAVEMLRRTASKEAAQEFDHLLSEMARLDHSVEELLFHAGTPQYVMARTDLCDVAREVVRVLEPLARHLGVELSVEAADEEVPVIADATKARQALTNLVLNGLKASEDGQAVTVFVRLSGKDAIIAVADRGAGPPEEIRDRVFEPFVTGRKGGTGLGLAVVRTIVDAHEGSVEMERRDGETTFTIRIPAAPGGN